MGYFVQWGIYGRNYQVKNIHTSNSAAKLTHINYAFSDINQSSLTCRGADPYADWDKFYGSSESVDGTSDCWDPGCLRGNFNQLKKLKAMHPNLKVHISIGGWTWSRYFSNAALPANRVNFVASCIDMYIKGNFAPGFTGHEGIFDGIDIDWEWPGSEGNPGNVIRPEDKQNLTALLAEFRAQLDQLSQQTGRTYNLTMFVPVDPEKVDAGFDVPQIMPYLDFITVQGYDFHGAFESSTMHQANLFDTAGDPSAKIFSVDRGVQAYVSRGAPPAKVVVGAPFYGRGWRGVPPGPAGNGLFQTGTGAAPGTWEPGIEDYKVLKNRSGTRFRDSAAGALWLYSGGVWWSYDDPQLITEKRAYINANGLGGGMFWELSGDDAQGSLISAFSGR